MTYHQSFDRLGHPLHQPKPRRSRQPIGHTVVQSVCVAIIIVGMAILYGGRP